MVKKEEPVARAVFRYFIETGEPASAFKIQEACGRRYASVIAALHEMAEIGIVDVVKVSKKGRRKKIDYGLSLGTKVASEDWIAGALSLRAAANWVLATRLPAGEVRPGLLALLAYFTHVVDGAALNYIRIGTLLVAPSEWPLGERFSALLEGWRLVITKFCSVHSIDVGMYGEVGGEIVGAGWGLALSDESARGHLEELHQRGRAECIGAAKALRSTYALMAAEEVPGHFRALLAAKSG